MSDPVKTPSETPNQPAVETPAAAAATSVAATQPVDPTQPKPVTETPAAPAAPLDPAAAAKAATDKAAADKAAADALAAKAADPAALAATEAQAKAKADADAAAAAAKAIPETYEIKLPNGLQVDPALIPALSPALKKAGLTQQQLQTVAESFIEFQGKLPQRMLDRDLDLTMKDPEIGGLNYGRTQGHVNAALGAFTHPEFRTLLAKSGLANNLEFVRVFERIGKAMAGDSPARGTPDGAPELSRAERMYGKTSPTQ